MDPVQEWINFLRNRLEHYEKELPSLTDIKRLIVPVIFIIAGVVSWILDLLGKASCIQLLGGFFLIAILLVIGGLVLISILGWTLKERRKIQIKINKIITLIERILRKDITDPKNIYDEWEKM